MVYACFYFSAGVAYFFNCCRWLAVERDDGRVEREFSVVETGLGFSQVPIYSITTTSRVIHKKAFIEVSLISAGLLGERHTVLVRLPPLPVRPVATDVQSLHACAEVVVLSRYTDGVHGCQRRVVRGRS